MKIQKLNWEEWEAELKRVAMAAGWTENGVKSTDWSAYRSYFDDGYSPAEALLEDMSYA